MRKPGQEGDDEDDAPPGGRALQRLHQFEQERGLEQTQIVEDLDEEDPDDELSP